MRATLLSLSLARLCASVALAAPGDPPADIGVVMDVAFVMKGGAVYMGPGPAAIADGSP